MALFPCPLLQVFWFCSPCTISSVKLTSVLFVCFWLRDKASDLRWYSRWYDDSSEADSVSAVFGRDRTPRLPEGEAEIETDFFCGHWQGTPLGAMGGLACAAIVHLERVMHSNGRRHDFLGLTGTMLCDGEARLLADALNALPARDPAAKAKTIELKQVQ